MAVTEQRPDLRRVRPGLYESTVDADEAEVTPEFAAAVLRHARTETLRQYMQTIMRQQRDRTKPAPA